MSNSIGGTTSGYGASGDTAASALASGTQNIANQETFLKLLVAQMQNQDPLNPMDGSQFVAQLAQFSELEQVIQIRQGVDSLAAVAAASAAKTSGGDTSSPAAGGANP